MRRVERACASVAKKSKRPWTCSTCHAPQPDVITDDSWHLDDCPHRSDTPPLEGGEHWLLHLGRCPMAFGDNRNRLCAWCGTPLPKARRRWCSDECGDTWAQNHSWTSVRYAALVRDRHSCVRCHRGPVAQQIVTLLSCLLVGPDWRDRLSDEQLQEWWRWNVYVAMEVNHRQPVMGRHAKNGCWHHLDGVETLCHPCHLAETAAQRARGWVAVDAVPVQAGML